MAPRSLALLVLLAAPLASCKTWPSRPLDGGSKGDATAAMDVGTDGNGAIDAVDDASDRDGLDAPPEVGAVMEDAAAPSDAGASDGAPAPDA
jgi:hypothetical protein